MWRSLVEQVRRAGPRKVIIILVLAAVAVALAYGNNSTNDAASGRTLPRAMVTSAALHAPPATRKRLQRWPSTHTGEGPGIGRS
jgi:hypothetical protein